LFDLSLHKALHGVTQPDVHKTLDELIEVETRHLAVQEEVFQFHAQRVEPRLSDQAFPHDDRVQAVRDNSDASNLKLSQERSFAVMVKGLEVIQAKEPLAYQCFQEITSATGRGRQDLIYESSAS
jgi:rubrerythrin